MPKSDAFVLAVDAARTDDAAKAETRKALLQAGASVRSTALVGSHATRYTVPPNGTAR